MGDIADMMLDGTLCEGCGVSLGRGDGYPRRCASCRRDEVAGTPQEKVKCKVCGKRVKKVGEPDHMKDAHGVPLPATEQPKETK